MDKGGRFRILESGGPGDGSKAPDGGSNSVLLGGDDDGRVGGVGGSSSLFLRGSFEAGPSEDLLRILDVRGCVCPVLLLVPPIGTRL